MARQLGWDLAGLSRPAETWPVPGARAGGWVGNEGGQSGANHPETASGTQDRKEDGRAVRAIMGVQQAECNGRFKAEKSEPLAQLAERTYASAKKSCQGPQQAPSSSPGELALPPRGSLKQVGKSRQSLRTLQGPGLPFAKPTGSLPLGAFSEGLQNGAMGPAPLPLLQGSKCQPVTPGCLLVWVHKCIIWLWEILRSLIIVP